MITTLKAFNELGKLGTRLEKIVGEKKLNKFLGKRKGLGKTRMQKVVQYTAKKPKSTLRRVKKINTFLDNAPFVAGTTGAGLISAGTISYLKGKDE